MNNVDTIANSQLNDLEKGGKRAVIGEHRTFGGREYIKTADGWKYHGKGKGKKAQSHKAGTKKDIIDKEAIISDLKEYYTPGKRVLKRESAFLKEVAKRYGVTIQTVKDLTVSLNESKKGDLYVGQVVTIGKGSRMQVSSINRKKDEASVVIIDQFNNTKSATIKLSSFESKEKRTEAAEELNSSMTPKYGQKGYEPESKEQLTKDVKENYKYSELHIQKQKIQENIKKYFPNTISPKDVPGNLRMTGSNSMVWAVQDEANDEEIISSIALGDVLSEDVLTEEQKKLINLKRTELKEIAKKTFSTMKAFNAGEITVGQAKQALKDTIPSDSKTKKWTEEYQSEQFGELADDTKVAVESKTEPFVMTKSSWGNYTLVELRKEYKQRFGTSRLNELSSMNLAEGLRENKAVNIPTPPKGATVSKFNQLEDGDKFWSMGVQYEKSSPTEAVKTDKNGGWNAFTGSQEVHQSGDTLPKRWSLKYSSGDNHYRIHVNRDKVFILTDGVESGMAHGLGNIGFNIPSSVANGGVATDRYVRSSIKEAIMEADGDPNKAGEFLAKKLYLKKEAFSDGKIKEDVVKKSSDTEILANHVLTDLEKGKPGQEGEVRTWGGKDYKKTGGKWIEVAKGRDKKKEDEPKGKSPKKEETSKGSKEKQEGTEKQSTSNGEIKTKGKLTPKFKSALKNVKNIFDSNDSEKLVSAIDELPEELHAAIPEDVWDMYHTHDTEGVDDTVSEDDWDDANGGDEYNDLSSDEKDSVNSAIKDVEAFLGEEIEEHELDQVKDSLAGYVDDVGQMSPEDVISILNEQEGLSFGDDGEDDHDAQLEEAKQEAEKEKISRARKAYDSEKSSPEQKQKAKEFLDKKKSEKQDKKDREELNEHFEDYIETPLTEKFSISDFVESAFMEREDALTALYNLEDEAVMKDIANGDYDSFDISSSSLFNDGYEDMMEDFGDESMYYKNPDNWDDFDQLMDHISEENRDSPYAADDEEIHDTLNEHFGTEFEPGDIPELMDKDFRSQLSREEIEGLVELAKKEKK